LEACYLNGVHGRMYLALVSFHITA
jgi:hypothetical protein